MNMAARNVVLFFSLSVMTLSLISLIQGKPTPTVAVTEKQKLLLREYWQTRLGVNGEWLKVGQSSLQTVPLYLKVLYKAYDLADQLDKTSYFRSEQRDHIVSALTARSRDIVDDRTLIIKFAKHKVIQSSAVALLVLHLKDQEKNASSPAATLHICSPSNICNQTQSIRRHDQVTGHSWDVFDVSHLLYDWKHARNPHEIEVHVDLDGTHVKDTYSLDQSEDAIMILANNEEDKDVEIYFGLREATERSRRYAPVIEDNQVKVDPHMCRPHEWKLSFADLGWDWVIAPKEFDANYCKGECPEPLPQEVNATNHARVKALYRSTHMNQSEIALIPSACCVPVKLAKMSMLYNYEGIPYMRRLIEMITKYCACV